MNHITFATLQAAAKRYHVTGTGKVLRRRPGKQHINEKMSSNHLKRLGKAVQIEDSNLSNVIGGPSPHCTLGRVPSRGVPHVAPVRMTRASDRLQVGRLLGIKWHRKIVC